MYESFYGLRSDPFRLLPDPAICFAHRSCARAWAYLRYALRRGEGIMVVTGPPGSGKTTLAERLLDELNPSTVVGVRLIAADLEPVDLLRRLAYAFGLAVEGMDRAMLADHIERHLIDLEQSHRRALVLIDEAQTLSHAALEALRRLTDLQSRSQPVLQLVLLGQEELKEVMAAPWMEQFQQRVIASCRLEPMSLEETRGYLAYRLQYADWLGDPSISGAAVKAIYDYSRGLPRHVNKIGSRLLLYGSAEERHALDEHDVTVVVRDLREEMLAPLDDGRAAQAAVGEASAEMLHDLALVPGPRKSETVGQTQQDAADGRYLGESPETGGAQGAGPYHASHSVPVSRARAYACPSVADDDSAGTSRPPPQGQAEQVGQDLRKRWGWQAKALSYGEALDALVRMGRALCVGPADTLGRRWRRGVDRAGDRGRLPAWSWSSAVVVASSLLVVGGVAAVLAWQSADEAVPATVRAQAAGHDLRPADEDAALPDAAVVSSSPETAGPVADPAVAVAAAAARSTHAAQALPSNRSAKVALDAPPADPDDQTAAHGGTGVGPGDPEDPISPSLSEAAEAQVAGRVPDEPADLPTVVQVRDDNATGEAPDQAAPLASGDDAMASAEVPTEPAFVADTPVALVLETDDGRRLDLLHAPSNPAVGVSGEGSVGVSPALPQVTPLLPEISIAEELPVAGIEAVESSVVLGDGTTVATAAAVPDAPDPVLLNTSLDEAVARKAEEVSRLLALADRAIADNRLLIPETNSAHHYLQRVLSLDAENAQAQAGIGLIVQRYAEMARNALDEGALDKAELFVGRGLRVDADNALIRVADAEVQQAIADAEAAAVRAAEIERTAAEYVPPPPVVEEEPKKETLSSLERLMRLVNGH